MLCKPFETLYKPGFGGLKRVVIKAIQYVQVKIVHVTFEGCATRDYYICSEHIELEGVNCCVLSAGPQAQQVLVYH